MNLSKDTMFGRLSPQGPGGLNPLCVDLPNCPSCRRWGTHFQKACETNSWQVKTCGRMTLDGKCDTYVVIRGNLHPMSGFDVSWIFGEVSIPGGFSSTPHRIERNICCRKAASIHSGVLGHFVARAMVFFVFYSPLVRPKWV